jgi:hypothetical protein
MMLLLLPFICGAVASWCEGSEDLPWCDHAKSFRDRAKLMSRAPWTPKQIASLLGNSAAAVTLEGSSFTIPKYQVRLCVVFLFFLLFFPY